jgi:alkylhydroperoxidase/carboxymuconolactone decarboxylase family protein YurZ
MDKTHDKGLEIRKAVLGEAYVANALKIREIFMQVAIYAGVPAGVDSFRIAREVFAEIDKG